MDLNKLLDTVTPEVYSNLKRAVEIGKWDNGIKLTPEQVSNSLQIIIAYDEKHKSAAQRVGYIEPKQHTPCGTESDDADWQTLNIQGLDADSAGN